MANVRCAFLSPLALVVLAGSALAQGQPVNDDLRAIKGFIGNGIPSVTPPQREGGAPPVNQIVFEITHPADYPLGANTRGTGGASAVFNDGNFPAFPPEQGVTYPLHCTAFDVGYIAFGPAVPGNFDIQVTFYDTFDSASLDCPFYSNVLGQARIENLAPFWGFSVWGKTDFAGDAPFGFHSFVDGGGLPTTIAFPDSSFGYEVRILQAGTPNLWEGAPSVSSTSTIVPMVRGPGIAPTIGSSTPTYWRNDPNLQGTPAFADICAANIVGSTAGRRDVYMKLAADIPPPPPPAAAINIGTLDCATSASVVTELTLGAGQFQWYRFTLGGTGATAASETYLDITTSLDPDFFGFDVDAAMAVYDSTGVVVASDEDDADLLYAGLTFGHGRRASFGDSIQFDGRDGDLPPGTYYLAVGGFGATFGGSGFNVLGLGSIEAGEILITINHNTGATSCPLPPPVAPFVGSDLGVLPANVTTAQVAVDFATIIWCTFTTTYDINALNPDNFLDINTNGSEVSVDPEIGVYDSNGNAVSGNWSDDNSGDGVNAQLSFGDPSRVRPGSGDSELPSGQNGATLPAGTYYLAVGLSDSASDVVFNPTGWQVRSNSGSSVNVNLNLRTPSGCVLDINGDGNVDPDDLSDAIACFFDTSCVLDQNGDSSEDPDDLADYIAGYFSGCP